MTARVTANTVPQVLFVTPGVSKGVLSSMKVDNQGATAITVRIQDRFTPHASAGVAAPTEVTLDRIQVTIGAGLTGTLSSEELKDVQILGTCEAVASTTDPAAVVIVGYHFI